MTVLVTANSSAGLGLDSSKLLISARLWEEFKPALECFAKSKLKRAGEQHAVPKTWEGVRCLGQVGDA